MSTKQGWGWCNFRRLAVKPIPSVVVASCVTLAIVASPPAMAAGLPATETIEELLPSTNAAPAVAQMFRWRRFFADGFQNPADLFPGDTADAVLAGAINEGLAVRLREMADANDKVSLTDFGRGTVINAEGDAVTIKFKSGETVISLSQWEIKDLVATLRKRKNKGNRDYMAIAVLARFAGDSGNVRKAQREVEGPEGLTLSDWLSASDELFAEMDAAQVVENLLSLRSPTTFVQQLEETWPVMSQTHVGRAVKNKLREMFEDNSFRALKEGGALQNSLQGKVKDLSTRSGDGGYGVEITYEFEDSAEFGDFANVEMADDLYTGVRYLCKHWSKPEPLQDWQFEDGKLSNSDGNLSEHRLDFLSVSEISASVIVPEDTKVEDYLQSFVGIGLRDDSKNIYMIAMNFSRLLERRTSEYCPSAFQDIQTKPGEAIDCKIKIGADETTVARNGNVLGTIRSPHVVKGRLFLVGGGRSCWYVDRLIVRGTVTEETVTQLARNQSMARSAALFGDA